MPSNDKKLSLIVELINRTEAQFKKIADDMDALNGQTKHTSEILGKVGAVSGVAFGALSLGIVDAVSKFGNFNSEILRAGAFVNATEAELKSFREAAIDAAQGTQFSAEQAAKALQNFVGGEISAAEAAENLASVIDLALVGKMTDLQQAVDIGGLALTVFKDDAMEMADVMDIIATVAADVTTQTDQWSTQLNNSAGAAKGASMSFKDLNVLFAQLKRGGASLDLMSSAVNSALIKIQSPAGTAREALEKVGLSVVGLKTALYNGPTELLQYLKQGFDEAQKSGQGMKFLVDTIGQQAAPEFALALGLTNEELAETSTWFDDIEGRGKKLADDMRAAEPPLQQLSGAFRDMRMAVGEALAPAFDAIVASLLPVVDAVKKFVQEHPKMAAAIVLITTALAGFVAIAAAVAVATPTLAIMATGVGAAFTGAAGGVTLFWVALGPIAWAIIGVSAAVAGLILYFSKLTKQFGSTGDALKYMWLQFQYYGLIAIRAVYDQMTMLIKYIPGIGDAFTKVSDVMTDKINSIESEMQGMRDAVKPSLQDVVDGIIGVTNETERAAQSANLMSKAVVQSLATQEGAYAQYALTGVRALDDLKEATIKLAITNGVLSPTIDALINGQQRAENTAESWGLTIGTVADEISKKIPIIADTSSSTADKTDKAFQRMVDAVKETRDEIVATYKEMEQANEDFLKSTANEESDYRSDIVDTVANAKTRIKELEKEIRDAKKDDEGGDRVSKLKEEMREQQDIIASYKDLGLDLDKEIAEERKRLAMNELERIVFDHEKKLMIMKVEYLQEQLQRAQKLEALKQEELFIITSVGVTKAAAINAELEKTASFRTNLQAQKDGLTGWMAETQMMYSSYVANVNSTLSKLKSSASVSISSSKKSGARALGGGVQPGRTFLVGERGPELFSPGEYGRISPNGSGGGVTIVFKDNHFTDDRYAEQITGKIVQDFKRVMKL